MTGVGHGLDKTRLLKAEFYCKERHKHSGNTTGDLPSTHGLLLEGEWSVYPSGELERLVVLSVKLEDPASGEILRVYLGSTRVQTGNANGLGDQTDWSSGHADGLRGQMDTPSVLNRAEMVRLGHREGAWMYLSIGDVKRPVYETDGARSHADVLNMSMDAPSVETDTLMPTNEPEIVRIPRKKLKPPDLPVEAAICAPDKSDGCGNHMDVSSVRMDGHSDGDETETPVNETDNVRTPRIGRKVQNPPYATKIATSKRARQWRKISIDNGDMYVLLDVPIETSSQYFVFGWLEGRDEAIAPRNIEEMAEDGDADRNGGDRGDKGDGDVDGTTSSGSIHSMRVKTVLLAEESQHMHQTRGTRSNGLPMSSRPLIRLAEHPYRHIRHCH